MDIRFVLGLAAVSRVSPAARFARADGASRPAGKELRGERQG
jgi:hypothetical protein